MRDWAHSRRLGTPADEAGYVVLRQPPASKLANLFRIDVRDHALGLVTRLLSRCDRLQATPAAGGDSNWSSPRSSCRPGGSSPALAIHPITQVSPVPVKRVSMASPNVPKAAQQVQGAGRPAGRFRTPLNPHRAEARCSPSRQTTGFLRKIDGSTSNDPNASFPK